MFKTTSPDNCLRSRRASAPQPFRTHSRRRRMAATSIEFAFVAPVFFMLFLGMVELGRGIMVRHMLMNAARQGCRVGILEGKGNSDITAAANSVLAPLGIASDTIVVQVNDGSGDALNANANDEVTVTVSVPISSVTWVPGGTYLNGSISSQYTLRKE